VEQQVTPPEGGEASPVVTATVPRQRQGYSG
jgi:hypothetical protein